MRAAVEEQFSSCLEDAMNGNLRDLVVDLEPAGQLPDNASPTLLLQMPKSLGGTKLYSITGLQWTF
jgi:hypothetical protein